MIFLIAAILGLSAYALWVYARWETGKLEAMGIPIVEYTNPLLRHARELHFTPGGLNDLKWVKKYGKIFGVYEGREPQLFIAEPDLIRQICVVDADHFNDRRRVEFCDPILNEFPDFQSPVEKWRIVKSLYGHVFSPAKMKERVPIIREVSLEFIKSLKQRIAREGGTLKGIPLDSQLHTMITELAARTLFSVKVNDKLEKVVKDMFTPPSHPEFIPWCFAFPFLKKFKYTFMRGTPAHDFDNLFRQMLQERRASGKKHNDVLDAAIEWQEKMANSEEFKQAGVTENTLAMQALAFLTGGQDQISTFVTATIYHMTKDEKLAKLIYSEVDKVFDKNGEIGFDQISELVNIQACIRECMRLYTFFHRLERVCTKDWSNKDYNFNIRKGTILQIPVWAVNRWEEFHENAEEFNHERFLPENIDKMEPFTMTSTGFGPRGCPGQRFPQTVMPILLAYMLRELKFIKREDSRIEFVPGGPFLCPHEPIYLDVVERKKM